VKFSDAPGTVGNSTSKPDNPGGVPHNDASEKYEVQVESGENIEASNSGPEKGPYVADTFPVTVEQQYVVIEID